jgi:caffeoyl-CoA O-methyltransferase
MEMTPQRWEATREYLGEVFGQSDEQMRTLMQRAVKAGLPDIAVSGDVGRLLQMLAMMACREVGSRGVMIEVGTLAGYSGIWLARGLGPKGLLITIEYEPTHAAFAEREFEAAGVGEQVRVVSGAGLAVLPDLASELGEESIDVAFIDAVKSEYAAYFKHLRPMIRRGGLFIADNALGAGHWWIDTPGPEQGAVDAFNRMVAADAGFITACVPIREGVLVARKL